MIHRSVLTRTRLAAVLLVTVVVLGDDPFASALQYQPIDSYSPRDECALVLDGPGRSSAFDYSYNLLRGTFPPSAGSQTCITYDAVNHAYIEARKRINVAQPNTENWRGEDLATVGELLLDISINLAQKYGLSYDDVEKGLPLIDTSKTLIHEVCPTFLSNVECRAGKYRRYDGLCTNLENPTWGATMTPFSRLLAPKYADGINAPRISVTGNQLPLARVVSRTMHPDEGYHDHAGTVMVIAWGQFMDHDYTLTATPLDLLNRNDPEECCGRPPHLKNPYCNEIVIPEDDYFYRLFNVRCMDFVRGFPAPRPGCRLGSRVQFNLLTGVLDGNTVYGVSETFARKLRTGYGGLLRMNPVFSEYGLKDLLPLKLDIPDEGCTRPNKSMYCFEAGEIRVNEQLVLTCMHTLLAREHNRAANALAQVNPHWDDETIFQEARRITIAEIQHVTYNEFLPILLGKEVMEKFGLLLEKDGYWDGYDSSVNPGVIDAFASAAYRFGHSLLPTAVERWSKAHKFIASKRLSDLIRRPYDLYRAGVLDEYFMGLMNQVAQAMDDSITQEVTNHLFKKVGAKFGMDLVSFNMQRGREFGIPSYMEFRKFCGLPGADSFEELFGSMPNETIRRYSSIFEHPSDVDLWSGGVSERPLPGSMLGPTFACIIATQFSYSRRGDRFWYELPNQPSSFTPEQLVEIRKSRLSRLICDNTDLIDTIQLYPMVLPDHEINPRVPCRSGVLPSIDFSKWAEFPSGTGHAAEYNFPGPWPLPVQIMPPLAYSRFPKTVKRKLVEPPKKIALATKMPFKLADLRLLRRDGSSYSKKLSINPKRDFRANNWPAIVIQQSTQIFGEIPAGNYLQRDRFDMPRPGYFFEKSEIEVSPVDNILREKRYSLKTFFDDLSRNDFSRRSGTRFRRQTNEDQDKDEEVEDFDQAAYVSRLLTILARDHRDADKTEEDSVQRKDHLGHRSKRQVGEERRGEGIEEQDEGEREKEQVDVDDSKRQINGREGSRYTPVYKDCNDTAASEISDLNAPPPPPERRLSLREYTRNAALLRDIDFVPKKNPPIINRRKNEDSQIPASVPPAMDEEEVAETPKETASTLKNIQNGTYINLQDHQKGAHDGNVPKDANGYPLDIPPYNPDVIPYVDVPDYSDQREESLDKDDRRVAKEKYVEYPDDDADVIDPGVTLQSDKPSEKIIVRDDDVLENDEVVQEGPNNSQPQGAEEVKEEDLEEEEVESGNSRVSSDDENVDEEKKNEETNSKNIRHSESDDVKDFEPIHFDINEYKKPFNLEELFKEVEKESHEAQENNKTKGSDVNEHQSSRNVPVRGDSHDVISGASGKYQNDEDFKLLTFKSPGKKENDENRDYDDKKNSHQDATIAPPNFFEEFERVFGPPVSQTPFTGYFDTEDEKEGSPGSSAGLVENEDQKYPYGDENTYDRLFGAEAEGDKTQDDDTYHKQNSDDHVAVFQGEKKSQKTAETKEPTHESLREAYKTLATILDRKDDISRLDDDIAKKAKEEGKVPAKYNNHWTLEYGTPIESEKT